MTASNGDQREGVSASQRPTMEMLEDDTLEIETLPPNVGPSEPPNSASRRVTVPGPITPTSSTVAGATTMPMEMECRLLIGMLQALIPLHTNLRVTPRERAYGRVCYGNAIVEPDGSVRLRPLAEAVPIPRGLVAPEVNAGGALDQQADLYSVGTLLADLVERHLSASGDDTLLPRLRAVAARGNRPDPGGRWASAAEFAEELEAAVGARLPSADALAMFTRDKQARLEALTLGRAPAIAPPPALPRSLPAAVDEESGDRQALAVPIDLDKEGGVEMRGETALATSGMPHASAPSRSRANKLLLLICVGSLLSVGTVLAMWTRHRVEAPLALSSERPPTPAAPILPTPPDLERTSTAGEATPPAIVASHPSEASRPSATASFPNVPAAASSKKGLSGTKPERRRSSTYDPEGI